MRVPSRFLLSVAGALVFGLLAGLVHGDQGGLRAAFGNLSAPWLLVALVPAWWVGSAVRGAVLGTTATIVALVGFYIGFTATMYGHLGEIHGVVHSFEGVLQANQIWFTAGLMSGPVCGAISGFLGARLGTDWLAAALGVLLVGEIVVIRAVQSLELPLLHVRWGVSDWRGYEVELTLGLLLLAALLVRRLRDVR